MTKDESANEMAGRGGAARRDPRRRILPEAGQNSGIPEGEGFSEEERNDAGSMKSQPEEPAPVRRPIRGRPPQTRRTPLSASAPAEEDAAPQRPLRNPPSRRNVPPQESAPAPVEPEDEHPAAPASSRRRAAALEEPDSAASRLARRRAMRERTARNEPEAPAPPPSRRRRAQDDADPAEASSIPSRARKRVPRSDMETEPEAADPAERAARRRPRHQDGAPMETAQEEAAGAAKRRQQESSPQDMSPAARRAARRRALEAAAEEAPAGTPMPRRRTAEEPPSRQHRAPVRQTGAKRPASPREEERKQPPKPAPPKDPPVEKGQVCPVIINSIGSRGEGIGHSGAFTVFVPYALPGEKVMAYIDQVKKSYAKGRLKDIPNRSKDRVPPACPIYTRCGGCQLQHMSYEAQLNIKQQQVIDAVTRIAKRPTLPVKETIGSPKPWNYRNKMQFPIGAQNGKIIIGCFARGTHDIVDTENCLIQDPANNAALNAVRQIVAELGIPVYDESKRTGILRHVVSRVDKSNCLMVTLVTATRQLPREKEFVRMLRERLPQVVSIQQNIQAEHSNVIMGRDTKLLWGSPAIRIVLNRQEFHLSPRSFFQVNTQQAEVLYSKALEYAKLTGREIVIDAYCGIGTITLLCAQKARKAIGIEIVPTAVLDAQKNARDSQLKNAEFIAGDATQVMPRLQSQGVQPDIVFVDPPRAGCTPEFLKTCSEMQPAKIIYISCNPASMARDIAILDQLGYQAKEVQPVDMFPQTSHVETVTCIERMKK